MTERERLENVIKVSSDMLREINNREKFAHNKEFVGGFFKYRNSFSCPESADDYWFMYTAVSAIESNGSLRIRRFQRDKNGEIEIMCNGNAPGPATLGDRISQEEFDLAWKAVMEEIDLCWEVPF